MRFALVGMTAVIALAAAALDVWAQPGQPVGQVPQARLAEVPPPATVAQAGTTGDSSGMIAFAAPVNDKLQQIVVIDTRERVLAIYHVELLTGIVELKSVRKVHWDLQMEQFNGTTPLPQAIRAKIEQLR